MTKQSYDSAQGVIAIIGIYEGVLPFLAKIFDWHPFLAFPVRLDAPWWWLVSGAVVVVAALLLFMLDLAGRRTG